MEAPSSSTARLPAELPDLDLDELSPLPPAQDSSRTTLSNQIVRDDRTQSSLTRAAQAPAATPVDGSPAPSQAPSSFRLEESPPGSPQLLGSPRLKASKPHLERIDVNISLDDPSQRQPTHHHGKPTEVIPAARYVTVSAILSRSEMYYPHDSEHWDILRSSSLDSAGEDGIKGDPYASKAAADQSDTKYSLRRRSQRKRPSNGSAIEALGALLLRKDSSGRVASLSFVTDDTKEKSKANSKPDSKTRPTFQSWTSALSILGRKDLEIRLPNDAHSRATSSSAQSTSKARPSLTIAERRARMWKRILSRQGAVVEPHQDGSYKVRSRREGLTFEVGPASGKKRTPATLLDLGDYKTAQYNSHHQSDPQSSYRPAQSPRLSSLPETIVLKAGKRPRLNIASASDFGIGSAYHDGELPEAPPSPVAMPGAWHGGSAWRSKPGDGYEEGALLLPPPLLDDQGSDPNSFEGLLGVRRMREMEKTRKQAEKLKARNRPTHKVGPLTALSNFVKAAHAAETSVKRAQSERRLERAPLFLRSQTAPQASLPSVRTQAEDLNLSPGMPASQSAAVFEDVSPVRVSEADALIPGRPEKEEPESTIERQAAASNGETDPRKSPASKSASPFLSSARRSALSRRGSKTNSLDNSNRQLNTVFESEPFDPANIPDDELASPDLPPISSPLLRPSSRNSIASSFRDFPSAPRLLPVQLSMPPSPFTPLAIDYRGDGRRDAKTAMIGSPISSDYLSPRNINHSAPRTPQLAATMLSLPPSPWTPYQDASAPPMIHLHLNASNSSIRLPPGTPRLIPTHLEILPSPFPTSAPSRRGSLTRDGGPLGVVGAKMANASRPQSAKVTEATTVSNGHGAFSASRSNSLERLQPVIAAPAEAKNVNKLRPSASKDLNSDRLTPSTMLTAAETSSTSWTESESAELTALRDAPPSLKRSNSTGMSSIRAPAMRRMSSSSRGPIHVDSSGRQRSFLLWFLIGDLGLRGSRTENKDGELQTAEADYGGLAAFVVHAFGFLMFVAAHLVDLAYSTFEKTSMLLWFLKWMLLNLTGRTVLAQCAIEAYSFIQAEWATVAKEDHENRGSKKGKEIHGERQPKGLTRWQVLRGLLELYCLHNVTRERYLQEGAGLKRLEGWKRKSGKDQPNGTVDASLSVGRLDIGAHRAASRNALDETLKASERSRMLKLQNSAYDEAHDEDEDEDEEEDDPDWDAEDEDDSDDEMIVTNRGDDILEFAKTPRLDAARPGQQRKNSGYFGRAYDFMTSPQVWASDPSSASKKLKTFKESNRDLVRTIKWCGRLAISAYGLHVHIVDLPPTFTPSGERFSRQTFAYLSRLNAEDVLHADIQTLDADADYSPTFYIVRDYVRKVVCVAVRGTQSFSDIIVDLDLQTEEIELPQVQPTPGEEFRCHAGIWRAAKALVSPQSKLFATLRQALEENEGFGIMFCGHSLGGAIASAAALLLAEYFIPDGAEADAGAWVTNMSSGLPARRPIRAVSFASPVTMTADLASRAALGSVPLVTTVVLGSDLIPRVGHGQVRELRRVLGALSRVRRRYELAAEGQEDARVHILRSYWDWRSISKAQSADDVMLHRKERIEEQLWSLRREVEADLYATVKAKHDSETLETRIPPSPWVGPEQRERAPLHQLATRRQELDTATLRSEAAQGGPLVPPGRCIWINEKEVYHVQSPLAFFSLPELRADMFAMHFPAAYEEAILALRT